MLVLESGFGSVCDFNSCNAIFFIFVNCKWPIVFCKDLNFNSFILLSQTMAYMMAKLDSYSCVTSLFFAWCVCAENRMSSHQ